MMFGIGLDEFLLNIVFVYYVYKWMIKMVKGKL